MKVNFSVALKEYDGTDSKREFEALENGKIIKKEETVFLKDLVARSLYIGSTLKYTDKDDENSDIKFRAYNLSRKIADSTGVIEISPEEACLIKQAANHYQAAAVYAQIVLLVK